MFAFVLLGLECDQFDNPADFFLDKITEAEVDLKPANPESNTAQLTLQMNRHDSVLMFICICMGTNIYTSTELKMIICHMPPSNPFENFE